MNENSVPKADAGNRSPNDPAAVSSIDMGPMLEATSRGEMTLAELVATLAAHRRDNPDAVWETLALADQYCRRGRINATVFAAIKTELNALAFHTRASVHAAGDTELRTEPRAELRVEPRVELARASEQEAAAAELLRDIARANELARENAASDQAPQVATAPEHIRPHVRNDGERNAPRASAAAASRENPKMYFREPAYETGVSAKVKIALGTVLVLAVIVVIGYMMAPTMPTSASNVVTKPAIDQHALQSQVDVEAPPMPAVEAGIAPEDSVDTANAIIGTAEIPADMPLPAESEASEPAIATTAAVAALVVATEATASGPISSRIQFVVDPIVVDQGGSVARITVRRSGSTRRELSMQWRTLEGSAKAERDFVPTNNGLLLFGLGIRDVVILVPIVQDATRQHSDWFEVEIIPSSDVVAGSEQSLPQSSAVRATVVITSTQAAMESEASPSDESATP